jgi:quercetin dioxygenase-like cupin family protein
MSSRTAVLLLPIGALAIGVALGFAAGRSGDDDSTGADAAELIAEGELARVPSGPVAIRAERVVLPAGFRSQHRHGGPTFNFVDAGAVVIESGGREQRYDEEGFFFEPAGNVHRITVLEDARLRVVRLLPPGAEATTEVP